MKVVLDNTNTVTLEDVQSAGGYRVVEDERNFFHPNDGVSVFIENPQEGVRSWVAYVRRDDEGGFDFQSSTRLPLEKSRITRVFM